MKEKEINIRFKKLREMLKLSQQKFGDTIGLKQVSIHDIEKGKCNVTSRNIERICREHNVNERWLRYGELPVFNKKIDILTELKSKYNLTESERYLIQSFMSLNERDKKVISNSIWSLVKGYFENNPEKLTKLCDEIQQLNTETEDIKEIPLYETPASAGFGMFLNDNEPYEIIKVTNTKADFAIRIKGDSMEPLYRDGQIIYVKKLDFLNDGQIGIFEYDGKLYLKKYERGSLISLNENYPDIKLDETSSFRTYGLVL